LFGAFYLIIKHCHGHYIPNHGVNGVCEKDNEINDVENIISLFLLLFLHLLENWPNEADIKLV